MSDSETETSSKRPRSESSEDEVPSGEFVEADFLFNDPSSDDFDGILTLLQGSMKSFDWNLPESLKKDRYSFLSQLISNQPNIGTLVKSDDDEDSYVMAVLSLLNLNQYEGLETFKTALLSKAQEHCDKADLKKLEEVLSNEKNQVGLLVNERMGNLPSQLFGQLHDCLKEDIKWSKENVEEEDESPFYNFTHVVGVSRLYVDNAKKGAGEGNLVYHKPEERFYHDHALVKFRWPTGESSKVNFYRNDHEKSLSKILPEHMFAYLLSFDKFNHAVREIGKNFKE